MFSEPLLFLGFFVVGRSVGCSDSRRAFKKQREEVGSLFLSCLKTGGGGGGGGGAAAKVFFLFRPEQALPSLPSALPLSRPFAPSPLDHSAEKKNFFLLSKKRGVEKGNPPPPPFFRRPSYLLPPPLSPRQFGKKNVGKGGVEPAAEFLPLRIILHICCSFFPPPSLFLFHWDREGKRRKVFPSLALSTFPLLSYHGFPSSSIPLAVCLRHNSLKMGETKRGTPLHGTRCSLSPLMERGGKRRDTNREGI